MRELEDLFCSFEDLLLLEDTGDLHLYINESGELFFLLDKLGDLD